jgi:peptidoglycan/LPS O-acetylase OafA/YrhL
MSDTSRSEPTRWRYVPGLDGLRGLSVLGPVLYHARGSFLPGGFLTIDLFFVLSSFLITSIAVEEWHRRGRVDLVAYAGRRAPPPPRAPAVRADPRDLPADRRRR